MLTEGTAYIVSQWKLPITKNAEQTLKIDQIQVRNNLMRCTVKDIDIIIEAAWPPNCFKLQTALIVVISKYRSAIKQQLVDDFMNNG